MENTQKISDLIRPILDEMSLRIYDVCWHSEEGSRILQIAVMHPDGTMDIDTCCEVSEKISVKLDEEDFISGEYFLEVCSPGAERELRNEEEIVQAVGEFIYVKLKNPKAGLDAIKGTLIKVENGVLNLDYMDKAVKKKAAIEMSNIALIRLSVKI